MTKSDKTTAEDQKVGEFVNIDRLNPHPKNPRSNDNAIDSIANSIRRFGFTSPIIANKDGTILAGHTRFKAANKLGLQTVPVVYVDLNPTDAELLMIADNKLGEKADWNNDLLKDLLTNLDEQGEDLDVLGFDDEELDMILLDVFGWDTGHEDIMDDIDDEVEDMENDVRRGMLFDFNADDYERLLPLQKKLRDDDIYMGSTILLALEKLYEDTQSTKI
ncbi:MAG: hypothetical protein GOVbin3250_31 [Prokaryotic dsDNA virus sp.]|nr:MAG: hypothetical protein GOVbin3250_31 [Prokaryotic dsDNA virus sp.]